MNGRFVVPCLAALLLSSQALSAEQEGQKTKAQPIKAPASTTNTTGLSDEQVYQQLVLKLQFEEFKSQLIRLARRLEQSGDASNQTKAKILRQAITAVNESGVEIKFEKLINHLKSVGKDLTLDDLTSIMEKHEDLHADIRAILVILLADDRDRLKKEIE